MVAALYEMTGSTKDFLYLMDLLASGNIELLEEAKNALDGFPDGVDGYIERHWITNAIDSGAIESIEWILSKTVDLSFRDQQGYTPILSAIDREKTDKYQVMQLLIDHGAPIDNKGINDWTPLHRAAAHEDIEALKLLVRNGADLTVRTEIDDYATPLEEAIMLKRKLSIEYLESVV